MRKRTLKTYYVSEGPRYCVVRAYNKKAAKVGCGYSEYANIEVRTPTAEEFSNYESQREIESFTDL